MYGLSKRFEGKPIKPPLYNVRDISHFRGYDSPILKGDSTIYDIRDSPERQPWKDSIGEMVLLCNEATRRARVRREEALAKEEEEANLKAKASKIKKRKSLSKTETSSSSSAAASEKAVSKPLSLEYLADRHDIDDPLRGYMIRTTTEKQLQGFIQLTTFTTWQSSFRWDSMHEAAFSYDSNAQAKQMARRIRQYDEDGTLAAALQSTTYGGSVDIEGIVWPRICELSLLGALGCGRLLVDVMIESLEREYKSHSYDYVVLQATDNSIPFYESCGFVRVGAIVENPNHPSNKSTEESLNGKGAVEEQAISPTIFYTTPTHNETPQIIAQKLQQQPKSMYSKHPHLAAHLLEDIMFLNKPYRPDLKIHSRLWSGTDLFVPDYEAMARDSVSNASLSDRIVLDHRDDHSKKSKKESVFASPTTIQWYVTKDNDTTVGIARKFNLYHKDLLAKFVHTNQCRIPHVTAHSVFKAGTVLQVSHLVGTDDLENVPVHHASESDDDEDEQSCKEQWLPYCHWTFPNEDTKELLDHTEPTYLMCKKLNVNRGAELVQSIGTLGNKKPKQVKRVYVSTRGLTAEQIEEKKQIIAAQGEQLLLEERRAQLLQAAVGDVDWQQKERLHKVMTLVKASEEYQTPEEVYDDVSSVIQMKKVSPSVAVAQKLSRRTLSNSKNKRKIKIKAGSKMGGKMKPLSEFFGPNTTTLATPSTCSPEEDAITIPGCKGSRNLFNQVVKLTDHAIRLLYGANNPPKYQYFYVLTFIPDLYWCHLAPMVPVDGSNPSPASNKKGKKHERPNVASPPKSPRDGVSTETWKLVKEELGEEIDLSAKYCIKMPTKMLRNCEDADKEQWKVLPMPASICNTPESVAVKAEEIKEAPKREPIIVRLPDPFAKRAIRTHVRISIPQATKKDMRIPKPSSNFNLAIVSEESDSTYQAPNTAKEDANKLSCHVRPRRQSKEKAIATMNQGSASIADKVDNTSKTPRSGETYDSCGRGPERTASSDCSETKSPKRKLSRRELGKSPRPSYKEYQDDDENTPPRDSLVNDHSSSESPWRSPRRTKRQKLASSPTPGATALESDSSTRCSPRRTKRQKVAYSATSSVTTTPKSDDSSWHSPRRQKQQALPATAPAIQNLRPPPSASVVMTSPRITRTQQARPPFAKPTLNLRPPSSAASVRTAPRITKKKNLALIPASSRLNAGNSTKLTMQKNPFTIAKEAFERRKQAKRACSES
jgi:hypothetical protein